MTSQASKDARRIRDRAKKARKRAKAKAAKLAALTFSKTSPAYRRQLPPMPPMSKSELRALLTAAVRNTAEMRA